MLGVSRVRVGGPQLGHLFGQRASGCVPAAAAFLQTMGCGGGFRRYTTAGSADADAFNFAGLTEGRSLLEVGSMFNQAFQPGQLKFKDNVTRVQCLMAMRSVR
jgi:hypothetical protein